MGLAGEYVDGFLEAVGVHQNLPDQEGPIRGIELPEQVKGASVSPFIGVDKGCTIEGWRGFSGPCVSVEPYLLILRCTAAFPAPIASRE